MYYLDKYLFFVFLGQKTLKLYTFNTFLISYQIKD